MLEIKPDIINSHGSWYCLLPGAIYKAIQRGTRLIHTFHAETQGELPYLGKLFIQNLVNRCDNVTFVSKKLETKIKETLGLKR